MCIQTMLSSFLSTSLTTLIVKGCSDVPLTLFLLSPNLRNLELERTFLSEFDVEDDKLATAKAHAQDPDWVDEDEESIWSARKAPSLVNLRYKTARQAIRALLYPPEHLPHGPVVWSELRGLSVDMNPESEGNWQTIRDIISRAQDSLVNLEITCFDRMDSAFSHRRFLSKVQ